MNLGMDPFFRVYERKDPGRDPAGKIIAGSVLTGKDDVQTRLP